MNTLTPDDLATLTARLEARRAEFGKLAQYLPELSAGVVRMAYEEIMQWEEERNGSQAERLYELRLLEFQRGYDAAMARLEDGDDADDEGDAWEGDRGGHRRFASVTPKGRAISINGDPNMAPETERAIGAMMDAVYERMNGRPAAIPVTDDPEGDPPPPPDLGDDFADPQGFAEQLRDAWPEMPDLVGVDRFAEHPVTGAPDDGPADDEPQSVEVSPDLRGYITRERLEPIAAGAGLSFEVFADKYDLWPCEICKLYGTLGENMREIEGIYYCDDHYPDDPDADLPAPEAEPATSVAESPAAAPQKSVEKLTERETEQPCESPAPDKPVGRARDPRVPDPDVARERLATALAQGSNGNARPVLRVPYPEPEPVDVARINQPRTLSDADSEQLKSARMGSEERAAQYREIILELQEMAVDGQMPSQGTWNADKPAHLPTHGTILARYNLANWAELAQRAKLTPIGRGNRPRKDAA